MNTSQLQQTIPQSGKLIIVDFWAPWCAPCRMTKPILEKLAQEYAPNVDFLYVNADDSRQILEKFHIVGIPTVLALREGNIVGRVTGAQDEAGYRAMFEALVEGKEVKIPLSAYERLLRLGLGSLLVIVGISTSSWLLVAIGGILTFLGAYDHCPIWAAISEKFRWR